METIVVPQMHVRPALRSAHTMSGAVVGQYADAYHHQQGPRINVAETTTSYTTTTRPHNQLADLVTDTLIPSHAGSVGYLAAPHSPTCYGRTNGYSQYQEPSQLSPNMLKAVVRDNRMVVDKHNRSLSFSPFAEIHPKLCTDGTYPRGFDMPYPVNKMRNWGESMVREVLGAYGIEAPGRGRLDGIMALMGYLGCAEHVIFWDRDGTGACGGERWNNRGTLM